MKHSSIFLSLILAATQCLANSPVVSEAQEETAHTEEHIPEGEQKIRQGIIMLAQLYQNMANVTDNATAEAAVPKIMKLYDSFRQFPQAFSNLPPLSEPEIQAYEDRYLRTIRKLNDMISIQANRLAAAEYYGSKNLPAALVRLAQLNQF